MTRPDGLLAAIESIAVEAGREILRFHHSGAFTPEAKADGSPVTAADQAAEALILGRLRALTPDIPVVAEESVAAGRVPDIAGRPFWCVDPLDGTQEFVARRAEFTVNIGLVEKGAPVLGVVHVPVAGRTYRGGRDHVADVRGTDGRLAPLRVRLPPPGGPVVVTSPGHDDPGRLAAYLASLGSATHRRVGSALKFCLVASGEADIYARLGRCWEWDTAAGQAVLEAAGGRVALFDGRPLGYGKPGFENPHFLAVGAGDARGEAGSTS